MWNHEQASHVARHWGGSYSSPSEGRNEALYLSVAVGVDESGCPVACNTNFSDANEEAIGILTALRQVRLYNRLGEERCTDRCPHWGVVEIKGRT